MNLFQLSRGIRLICVAPLTLVALLVTSAIASAQTNPTAQNLPYYQDFFSLAPTSTVFPAGWQGWTISAAPGAAFDTSAPTGDLALTASGSASSTAGNVYNFSGKIGYLNTGTADRTVALAVNTTGVFGVTVSYDIMTMRNNYNGTTETRINEVTLQYRVGTSGSFTNVTGVEYQNNTTAQTSGTIGQKVEFKSVTLPAACDNQAVVQLRWASREVSGAGARPSFAVDNLIVSGPYPSLVGHWRMEENTGASLIDASTRANHAALTGSPTWGPGVVGQFSLNLNGSTQFGAVPDNGSLRIPQAITLAAWVKPVATGTQYVIKKAASPATNPGGYELSLAASGRAFVRFSDSPTNPNLYRVNSVTSYPTGGATWMHLAATYDGSTIRLYVNGVLDSSKIAVFSIAPNNLALGIGAQGDGTSKLNGAMDEARVYRTALSPAEITDLAGVPTASLTAPNGGQNWTAGTVQNITWSASDNIGVSNVDLELSTDGGSSWSAIATGIANTGSYAWTVSTTATTTARVRVTAHDALLNAFSDASDANFTISAPVAVTTTTLPNGQVGSSYSQFLAASGGVTPYTWAVTVGSLPAGLSLNPNTGEISGTPSATGTTNFTVAVTDANSATDDQALSLTVDPATTLAITTTSLPDGQVGASYSQFLAATGGVMPYTWAAFPLSVGLPPNSTTLQPTSITATTGEKPQSKVWTHAGTWWCVLPSATGTWVKRLDGTTWTDVLKLSDATNSKADVKSVGNVAHVLLFEGVSSELVSIEYVSVGNTYQLWTSRPAPAPVSLDSGVEIATIDIDSQGRMWLASDGSTTVTVRHSDPPYSAWSAPFTLGTGVSTDDIAVVTAFPDGKMGVLWSNQTTQRFGFRTHTDGADPTVWSADEVPASQSALNVGLGMADDHLNLSVAADGTLYAAVKTSYDTPGYPKIALLVRRPAGTWDNLYEVDQNGTRGIVLLNEKSGTVSVVYTASEGFNPILHKETSTASIAFTPSATLISTSSNDCSSTKQNISDAVVILASTASSAIGVLRSTLPAGLSLNTGTGEISGTPSATGTTNFAVEVMDANSATDTQALAITVNPPTTLAITTTSLSNGQVGTPYSQFLAATGGVTPYTWAVTVGSLPAGLSLNSSTGEISGTPSATGTTNFTVAVTDANSATDNQALSLTVAGTPVGYWPMEEGSGTSIQDASGHGNHGSVQGGATWGPGQIGMALILDGVDDHAQVPNSPTLDITSQITLATWVRPEQVGTQYLIKKAIQGSTGGYELSLSSTGKAFFRLNQVPSGDTYRLNSLTSYPITGTTWMHLAATYDGATLRLYVNGVEEASAAAAITIASNTLSLGIGAQSNGTFFFKGAMDDARVYASALSAAEIQALANPGLPTVTVLSPNGGEEFAQGSTQNITWTASDDVGVTAIDLDYSTNGGASWTAIASGLSNSGSYPWTVPNVVTTHGRVRATAHDASAYIAVDISNADFAIVDPTGPVGWWPFNEGGGTSVLDVSGLANHGTTFNGPTWTLGLYATALDLDGTDDYALVPDDPALDLTTGITMMTWIRPEVVGTQYLIKKAVMNTAGGDGYELSLSSVAPGKPFVRFNQVANGNLYRLDATQAYPTDGTTWMHVAATYDGATIKLYINGVLDSSQAATFTIVQNNLALGLGAQSNGTTVYRGAMDEARLYGRALSAAEIAAIANLPPVGVDLTPPTTTRLSPAMPTPFQNTTTLQYTLGAEGDVELSIFGLDGRRVRTLARGHTAAGVHRVSWDGRDDGNQQVGAGVYFVRLVTPQGAFHRRLVRLQ